jgi:hypothetical protein
MADDARQKAVHQIFQDGLPDKLCGDLSFQFGLASASTAPQTVQTMRGPNDGTTKSSEKPLTSIVAS